MVIWLRSLYWRWRVRRSMRGLTVRDMWDGKNAVKVPIDVQAHWMREAFKLCK